MTLVNGWIIADKSMYGNFTRFRKDAVDSYIWYANDDRDSGGNLISHQNHITVFTKGTEHKIYYKNKKVLLDSFRDLEKIMWDFEDEEPKPGKAYVKEENEED